MLKLQHKHSQHSFKRIKSDCGGRGKMQGVLSCPSCCAYLRRQATRVVTSDNANDRAAATRSTEPRRSVSGLCSLQPDAPRRFEGCRWFKPSLSGNAAVRWPQEALKSC